MKHIRILMPVLALALTGSVLVLALSGANPVPLIDEPLVPAAVAPGGAGFTLTVNGTGFVSGAVVNWNGSARPTIFVSSSQLTASILAADIASAGTASVTVVNPTPGGGVSNVTFLPVTTAAGTVVLSQSGVFQSGGAPRQAIGDFNHDGKLDLAVTDSSGIQILLGKGDGTFQPAVLNSLPAATFFVIVGDFNGDGKLDLAALAITGSGFRFVTILLGHGDGTFQGHIDSPIDTSIPASSWLAAGDLNGDGKLDLVVGYQGGSAVSVLLGNGDGTFQPFVDYTTAAQPNAVAIGDFNGDGKLDLATANFGTFGGHTVSILLGNGDGTFQPHVEYQADGGPLSLVAADFNGDGKLDLAVDCSCGHSSTCGRPGTVAVLLGNGDGTFKPPVIYDVDEFPYTITTGDFNGDGKLDLAVTDFDSAKISFLLGKSDGTFQPHFELSLLNSLTGLSGGPLGLVTGDFNGDGLLDLVTDGRPCCQGGTIDQVRLLLQTQVPVAALSTASLNFGGQDVGSTSPSQTATLNNPGRAQLTVSSISMNGPDFAANTGTCLSGVAPGANCTLGFTFMPTAPGPANGVLTITDNADDSPQTVALSGMGEDFSLSSNPTTATVTAGGTATYTLSVAPLGGFNQAVTLSCTGAPMLATCMVTPNSVTPNGTNSITATVTVSTTARSMAPPASPFWPPAMSKYQSQPVLFWLLAFAVVASLLAGMRRRVRLGFAMTVLVVLLAAACGGGGGGRPGTPSGTFTVTVTGTSGSLQHSIPVTLVVQ